MQHDSDADIARACLANAEGAHEELLGRYQVRLFSFILRLTGNATEAEDLCQETFLKAFEALESYDPARPMASWLFGIAHHLVIDFIRANKPHIPLDEGGEPLELEDAKQSLESRAQEVFDARVIERLLADLPPLFREVMVLRHSEDLDYAQIAEILELPEGTVKIRLFRARKLLKDKLESLGYRA